jgi:hypothetical protein
MKTSISFHTIYWNFMLSHREQDEGALYTVHNSINVTLIQLKTYTDSNMCRKEKRLKKEQRRYERQPHGRGAGGARRLSGLRVGVDGMKTLARSPV